ncbi:NAD-dependent epimerase/dehydratase family protein [Enhygromyxa salina]|uniref:3 beta-hydroxysteroid dehydrogenase/Delta 5-->4-isomerase n=1 Tax=Enhygromyxa salina TaxID=215803 RepID=A0A2S9XL75_9BACT|nr:NAD-dependent epimerase/dehydratase family protein [Enhygromyxa salina]PRP93592.1 3 beta-hydroxysteroid dehydrogenase/Delta 5-->4-isomerase [Enhygromyxa salina]
MTEVASDTQAILVTGATGFLGAHVVAALREQGRSVVALVRNPDAAGAKRVAALGATLATGDVLDVDSIEAAAAGCSAVLHCAGKVSRDGADAVLMTKVNVGGVGNVLAACKRAGVKRAVIASTSGTLGVSTDPDAIADETTPAPLELINKWPYYRSKYYGEQVALEHDGADFEVVIVNPALLLGPGDHQGSSTEDVRRALEQRTPVVPAGGYTFVDARDAAEGMILALDKGRAGQRYLLVSCNCPIRTFYSRIARVAGLDGSVFALPDHQLVERATRWLVRRAHEVLGEDDALPDAISIEMAQHYWYVDSTLAENELGWRARDPMITLADTVADLRERGVVMMRAT